MENQLKLESLGKLIKKLSHYDLDGYAEVDQYGNLIIRIPGAGIVLDNLRRESVE